MIEIKIEIFNNVLKALLVTIKIFNIFYIEVNIKILSNLNIQNQNCSKITIMSIEHNFTMWKYLKNILFFSSM